MAIASDYLYLYVMRREDDTALLDYESAKSDFYQIRNTIIYQMSLEESLNIDVDGFDEIMKIMSKKYNFSYRRILKNGK